MSTKILTSFSLEEIAYATSRTNSEQHALPLSTVLHLLPGILIGTVFFLLAPIVERNGLPSFWAFGIADLVVLLPFVFGLLFYEGYKRNGRLSLDGVVLYREPIPWWQYLLYVPIAFFTSAIVPLLGPASNFIYFLVARDV
jgi:glucan phosphoethanolaminetransferase (alkaline phosphatase superfamily)